MAGTHLIILHKLRYNGKPLLQGSLRSTVAAALRASDATPQERLSCVPLRDRVLLSRGFVAPRAGSTATALRPSCRALKQTGHGRGRGDL